MFLQNFSTSFFTGYQKPKKEISTTLVSIIKAFDDKSPSVYPSFGVHFSKRNGKCSASLIRDMPIDIVVILGNIERINHINISGNIVQ